MIQRCSFLSFLHSFCDNMHSCFWNYSSWFGQCKQIVITWRPKSALYWLFSITALFKYYWKGILFDWLCTYEDKWIIFAVDYCMLVFNQYVSIMYCLSFFPFLFSALFTHNDKCLYSLLSILFLYHTKLCLFRSFQMIVLQTLIPFAKSTVDTFFHLFWFLAFLFNYVIFKST